MITTLIEVRTAAMRSARRRCRRDNAMSRDGADGSGGISQWSATDLLAGLFISDSRTAANRPQTFLAGDSALPTERKGPCHDSHGPDPYPAQPATLTAWRPVSPRRVVFPAQVAGDRRVGDRSH